MTKPQKKSKFERLKVLIRPTGKPLWATAVKSFLLMALAVLIARFLGWDNGLSVVALVTIVITRIIDIDLPVRKVAPLAFIGFIMAMLAFTSVSLGSSSDLVFILITVIWAFFCISLYIFGKSIGFFGYIIFVMYFIAVIVVNDKSTTMDYIYYCLLAFLVASILFIPRLWKMKQDLRNRVAVGFIPQSSLQSVLKNLHALSGVPLDSADYELFRLGTYLSGFREYSKLLYSRISDEYQDKFKEYLEDINKTSLEIGEAIIKGKKQVNLDDLNEDVSSVKKTTVNSGEKDINAFLGIGYQMVELLKRSAELLSDGISGEKLKIFTTKTSLKDILRANFNLKNVYMRHAVRFALAMTVGLLLVHLTHGRDVIWVTMGILIVIRPDVTSTINSMVVRVLYNLLAIIIAIILAFFFPHQILLIFALIMIFLALAWLPNYVGPSIMALTVFTVLIWPTGTVFENSIARIIDITLGAIIAIICAYVILPSRVTMDLPGLLASTLKANQEYMKTVIVPPEKYNHQKAVQQFNNYLLQENNLEAAIGKLQDFFTDISNDMLIYEDMIAVNHKLFADISVLGALQEKKLVKNVPIDNQPLTSIMDDLIGAVERDVKPRKTYLDSSNLDETSYVRKDLDQYVYWVISDIGLLQELVRSGSDEYIFGKYRDII
ncbi:MAG: hypothetical protein A4E25_00937 [Methanobacterium sp. PtaB.Bin024]|nr:MAG: hypothetical protein A4E25_00937 [Methanobacterium sp. PtaB.Bin024]